MPGNMIDAVLAVGVFWIFRMNIEIIKKIIAEWLEEEEPYLSFIPKNIVGADAS